MMALRNIVSSYSEGFNVMFSGSGLRAILSVLISGLVFAIVTMFSGSEKLGGVAGICFIALFIFAGWLPMFISFVLIFLSAVAVFSQIMDRGRD